MGRRCGRVDVVVADGGAAHVRRRLTVAHPAACLHAWSGPSRVGGERWKGNSLPLPLVQLV